MSDLFFLRNPHSSSLWHLLCEVCDPHQLFQRLEAQVREFVIEIKVRLLQLMEQLADNPQLPLLFISGMLDHYEKLMNAASKVSPVLSKFEDEHLSKFNLSWELLNKWLFHTSIYTDSFFENSVPLFIKQLGKLKESFETNPTVHSFLKFDDEVTLVESQWKFVAQKIQKYCQEQAGPLNCQKHHIHNWHGFHLLKLNLHNFCDKIACGEGIDLHNSKQCLNSNQVNGITSSCECDVCLKLGSYQASHVLEIMDLLSPALTEEGYNLFPHLHNSSVEAYEVVCADGCSSHSSVSEETAPESSESSQCPKKSVLSPTKNGCSSLQKLSSVLQRVDKATQKDHEVQSFLKDSVRSVKKKSVGTGTAGNGNTGNNSQPIKEVGTISFCSHSCSHIKHSDKIKRVSCSERFDNFEVSKSETPMESKLQSCDCCYCEVFGNGVPPTAPMSRNYMEMRERLRFILSKKRTNCKASNVQVPLPIPDKKGLTKENIKSAGDTRNLEELIDFIEGNENKERNEKKAAKKARQKERKIQLIKQKEEEERAQEVYRKALAEAEQAKAASHEKNTKSSKKKNKIKNSTPSEVLEKDSDSAPKMLTIKRIMDSSSSEPTVTITLRGATPNQDRVLYTLLNGQVCEMKDSKKMQFTTTGSSSTLQNKSKPAEGKPPSNSQKAVQELNTSSSSNKKQKKKNEAKIVEPSKQNSPEVPPPVKHNGLTNPTAIQINNAVNRMSKNDHNSFKIEDLKLPPGITITKVDPSTIKSKVPIKEKPPPSKPITVPPSLAQPPSSSEVIVVATGNLKDQNIHSRDQITPNGPPNPPPTTKKKKNKKNKNESNLQLTAMNNNNYQKAVNFNGHNLEPLKERSNKHRNINPVPINSASNPKNNQSKRDMNAKLVNTHAEEGKKKKKKSKSSSIYDINSEELRLLDSVFAPKDIDLENGDIDDAERELEAFKRFCLQSVPPKRKEKVHLNIKDIILRKKTTIYNES